MARLALRTARPRDFARLRQALNLLPRLQQSLAQLNAPHTVKLGQLLGEFPEEQQLLERAIVDNPPMLIRDGGVIREGYNAELDEWRGLSEGATDYLVQLEAREKSVPALPR